MDFLYQGLGYVMRFCYDTIGFGSYALALFWFALIAKLILLPFGIKQQKNQIKGAKLRPKLYAIEKKYAGRTDRVTMQKKQQEIMEMQQREGYSPLSGCLPMLIQLPLILLLYGVIRKPLSYISQIDAATIQKLMAHPLINVTNAENEIEIISKINAAGGVDAFADILPANTLLPNFDLFGGFIDLASNPSFWSWALIIPALVFITQFLSMKLTRILNPQPMAQAQTKETEMSMKIMDLAMPAMTLFLGITFPAALGLYWIYQSVLAIGQMLLLSKLMPMPTFTEEELKAAERELRGKAPKHRLSDDNADRPRPRSLHYIDEDDEDLVVKKAPKGGSPKGGKGITSAPLKDDKNDDED